MKILVAIPFKKNINGLFLSLCSVALLYFFVWVGSNNPIILFTSASAPDIKNIWIILLFIYASIASLLPVWVLLQPRDYINSHQLFIGLALLFLGVIVSQPIVSAPAISSSICSGRRSAYKVTWYSRIFCKYFNGRTSYFICCNNT